jgi:hypothetical protein
MDINTISTIIAAISVVVGVFFAILELRKFAEQRKTDFLYRLQSSMIDESYRKAWKKVRDSEGKTYKEIVEKFEVEFELVIAFYENLGILLDKQLVDSGIVRDVFGKSIIRAWERCETYIKGARKEENDDELYKGFQKLYEKTREVFPESRANSAKQLSSKPIIGSR